MGFVEHIHIAPAAAAATRSMVEVRAVAGVGLEGDRYAVGKGYWSPDHKVSRDLTLIEAEVVEDVAREHDPALAAGETRRNVTTRGIRLNDLVGVTFRIGEILCEGIGLCEPCRYLESITGRRLIVGLVHRGGLRARLLSSGVVRIGDPIVVIGARQPEAHRRPDESIDRSGPASS